LRLQYPKALIQLAAGHRGARSWPRVQVEAKKGEIRWHPKQVGANAREGSPSHWCRPPAPSAFGVSAQKSSRAKPMGEPDGSAYTSKPLVVARGTKNRQRTQCRAAGGCDRSSTKGRHRPSQNDCKLAMLFSAVPEISIRLPYATANSSRQLSPVLIVARIGNTRFIGNLPRS